MLLSDLVHGRTTVLHVRATGEEQLTGAFETGAEVGLRFSEAAAEAPLMRLEGTTWNIEGADEASAQALARLGEERLPYLAWLVSKRSEGSEIERITISVHQLRDEQRFDDPITIGVDESLLEQVGRKLRSPVGASLTLDALTDALLLPPAPEGGAVRALACLDRWGSGQDGAELQLFGRQVVLDVRQQEGGRLMAHRLHGRRQPSDGEPITLLTAPIRFVNADAAAELRHGVRTELERIAATTNSYLELWREYNGVEQALILERARALGSLRYTRRERLSDGRWKFWLERNDEGALPQADDRARRLADLGDATFEASVQRLQLAEGAGRDVDGARDEDDGVFARPTRARRPFLGEADGRIDGDALVLRPLYEDEEREPPARGFLHLSLTGDARRIERRIVAAQAIRTASCAMPRLGLILEGRPGKTSTPRTIRPIVTPAVVRAFGGRQPSAKQVEALGVALNTPDIALIQGPPGTGKTDIIAGLQARLGEIAQEQGQVAHTTLLTSYQHDAVENAVARTRVLGLPPIVESRRRRDAPTTAAIDDRWRTEEIRRVREVLEQMPVGRVSRLAREIRDRRAAYLQMPGVPADAADLLEDVARRGGEHLPWSLVEHMGARALELRRQSRPMEGMGEEERVRARVATRAIRVTVEAFGDDGPITARRALTGIERLGVLTDEERRLLTDSANWIEGDPTPSIEKLAALRDRLLDELRASPLASAPNVADAETDDLLGEAVDALEQQVRVSPDGAALTVERYLDDLENDPEGVRETLRAYTAVLAATCQQSASHRVRMTALGALPGRVSFETVVVDEASRANPLDLFVPMAMARRRIVLVGDHRQLPHLLEPDVERELRAASPETRRRIEKSLFQVLFEQLQAAEARDGIRRTVTLNTQYRMHPVLGDFVSQVFYQREGDPQITAGRSAEEFAHALPGHEGKVAGWLYVLRTGRDDAERPGRSKARPAEARRVAAEVKKLLDAEASRGLTFGIITFYTAQVQEIWKALERVGVAVEREDGTGYEVAARYSASEDREGRPIERLRVGTVDAFQGKEFDVVLLSMVRSNDLEATPEDEASLRRKYGHLTLANRLCVAMSRQRRLLIVAGDLTMARGEAAQKSIPALAEFLQLCQQGRHGRVYRG